MTVYLLPADPREPLLFVWIRGQVLRDGWERVRELNHGNSCVHPSLTAFGTTAFHALVASGWAERVVYVGEDGAEVERPKIGPPRYSLGDLAWFVVVRPIMWRMDPEVAHEASLRLPELPLIGLLLITSIWVRPAWITTAVRWLRKRDLPLTD